MLDFVTRLKPVSQITHVAPNVYSRDNYNNLTSAKLPPKNGDGQLKSICVDKKANKINILIRKIIHVIRTREHWR